MGVRQRNPKCDADRDAERGRTSGGERDAERDIERCMERDMGLDSVTHGRILVGVCGDTLRSW